MEQSKLGFERMTGPREFTRDGVLDAVAKLIATDDQVRYTYIQMIVLLTLPFSVLGIGQQKGLSKLPSCDATKIH